MAPAFGVGVFAADYFLWLGVTYDHAARYDTRDLWGGSGCDLARSGEMDRGATFLAIGVDITRNDGTCTLLTSRAVDDQVLRGYASGTSSPGDSPVDLLYRHTRAYVITALSEVDAGSYVFVAETRLLPVAEQFKARFELADTSTVAAVADALSDAGLVVTAGTGGPSGYGVVGTRPAGDVRRLSSLTVQNPGVDPAAGVGILLDGGFAPVALLLTGRPDGGFEIVSIGQK